MENRAFRYRMHGGGWWLQIARTIIVGACIIGTGTFAIADELKQTPSPAVAADTRVSSAATQEAPAPSAALDAPVAAAPVPVPEAPAPEAPATEEPAATVEPGNVTVNFKGADIKTVLAYLSEVAGIDIVPAPDVKGTVDLKLTNKPWKVALDIIVRNYGYAYEVEGNIIRVITVEKLKQEELATQAFSLDYGKSKDVVASIKDIITDRGKIMYDERTNMVLVTDIPTNLYKIGQIIEKLDQRTLQVLITARIIETTLTDDERLGIDWNAKFSANGAKRPMTFPFELSRVPFGLKQFFPVGQTAAPSVTTTITSTTTTGTANFPNNNADGTTAFPFVTSDAFSFGTLDFSQFSMVMEMIEQRGNTDIVSNPRVATLNNMEASILVGQTLNLPKFERNSTTGKMEITGYVPKDLGIKMKVTPHINSKGEIVTDLAPEISDLLRYDTIDAASGLVAPVFSMRQATTQIMVHDGDTIFIGGLIRERDVNRRTKLPFLGDMFGDVPYLGLLFTKKDKGKEKTELIFFITVHIMTVGKEIGDAPLSDKAYTPKYSLTQQGTDPHKGQKKTSWKKL